MLTKKLNEGVVTTIADTDLVTVCDSGGSVKPISFANLMSAIRGGIQISTQNLSTLSRVLTYDDSAHAGESRTYPLNIPLYEAPISLKKGDIFSIYVEDVEVLSGNFSHLRFSIGGAQLYVLTKHGVGYAATVTVPSNAQVSNAFLYPVNPNGSTGGIKCNIKGLTVVRGNVPMTGWLPSLSKEWGG